MIICLHMQREVFVATSYPSGLVSRNLAIPFPSVLGPAGVNNDSTNNGQQPPANQATTKRARRHHLMLCRAVECFINLAPAKYAVPRRPRHGNRFDARVSQLASRGSPRPKVGPDLQTLKLSVPTANLAPSACAGHLRC